MRLRSIILCALAATGCNQTTAIRTARLIGTHDLVLVSDNPDDELLATKVLVEGGWSTVGTPSRYVFVTSADTNELRLLDNFPGPNAARTFTAAPNPLETLSIPVLDRPTMLAVDEGRDAQGGRVTGRYVYAARAGGAEVSVVDVRKRRQVSGRPFATPAPVTAIGAFMEVDHAQSVDQTKMPATTDLYVATWDGDFAAVYRSTLETRPMTELERLDYERVVLIDDTPISAMLVVAPLGTRTLDGAPFCATSECLAISTRLSSGAGGETFLIDPSTGQRALLSFSGPVRKLVSSANGGRIYGVLDEQTCGGAACGGVVAVDVAAAVTPAAPPAVPSFPAAKDATGAPMPPLRAGDGLITGLAIGAFHRNTMGEQRSGSILQPAERFDDQGALAGIDVVVQEYTELGAFASSSGVITFFSGLAGSIIDYDARRSTVTGANVRVPGMLADGGLSLFSEDGGALGANVALTVEQTNPNEDTFRVLKVTGLPEGGDWTVDISDGYLQSQTLVFVYQGQLPGLVSLPTSADDGLRLFTGGAESRAAVGDIVRFETGSDTQGYAECGRSRIQTLGAGFIEVADLPAGCEARVRFSVRADGAQKLVAVAELEGYLGRFAPGEMLTYNRPYVLLPARVVASRTSLTVTVPTAVPEVEGAVVSFLIAGNMQPYQLGLDTLALNGQQSSGGCFNNVNNQVVIGNMLMDRFPTAQAAVQNFRWGVMGVVPSSNSVVEVVLEAARAGALNTSSQAICYR